MKGKVYTVWSSKSMPDRGYKWSDQGVNEKCLMRENGDYIGLETGTVYEKENFHHSEQFRAKIVAAEKENNTGMYHLDKEWEDDKNHDVENRLNAIGVETKEDNKYSWKSKYIGCYVTVERAHLMGGVQIYRCKELGDYWTENEIKIIEGNNSFSELFDWYISLLDKVHEYFDYKEDWRVIPLEDARKYYWYLTGEGSGDEVYYADDREKVFTDHRYSSEIYTQRFLPKWVYRGEEYTMVCADPHVDGNKFLMIFDNSKEIKVSI